MTEEFIITGSNGSFTRDSLKGAINLVMQNMVVERWQWGEVRGCHGEGEVLFRAEWDGGLITYPRVVSAAKPHLQRWVSGTLVHRPE